MTGTTKQPMTKRLILAGLLLPAMLLGACNTTEGLGKDMQSAGKEVAKTADDAK